MNNMPCANTEALNRYMRELDREYARENAVEKLAEEYLEDINQCKMEEKHVQLFWESFWENDEDAGMEKLVKKFFLNAMQGGGEVAGVTLWGEIEEAAGDWAFEYVDENLEDLLKD